MSLDEQFPAPTRDDWEALAQNITKGVVTDEALATITADDICIRPLYDRADLESIMAPQNSNDTLTSKTTSNSPNQESSDQLTVKDWEIRQLAVLGDAISNLPKYLSDIEAEGATGVWLKILTPTTAKQLKQALKGTNLRPFLDAGPRCFSAADAYLKAFGASSITAASLNLDPLGALVAHGELEREPDDALKALASYAQLSDEIVAVGVNAGIYGEAGATEAEQISLALATGVDYLRAMTDSGLDLETAAKSIEFTLSVTPELFRTIAFVRAFRICWLKVLATSGVDIHKNIDQDSLVRIHIVTSSAHITKNDKWVNLLRATAACFGATLGGADSVTVLPLDHGLKTNDPVFRRLAMNVSHILKKESQIPRVKDPIRGSFYLESLTKELAKAGWENFREIEKKQSPVGLAPAGAAPVGGKNTGSLNSSILNLLLGGDLKKMVDHSWEKTEADIATRKKPILGLSEFPDLDGLDPEPDIELDTEVDLQPEQQLTPLKNPAFSVFGAMPVLSEGEPDNASSLVLSVRRIAEPYERLISRSQKLKSPSIFFANLGLPAQHIHRSNFAKNFFGAAKISAHKNDSIQASPELSPTELGEAYKESGLQAAVICGTDEQYGSMLASVVEQLKAKGCKRIYLAGAPKDSFVQAGVELFIHKGCNAIQTLEEFLDFLEAGIDPTSSKADSSKESR